MVEMPWTFDPPLPHVQIRNANRFTRISPLRRWFFVFNFGSVQGKAPPPVLGKGRKVWTLPPSLMRNVES